ncbi:uncharacterized protein PITG_15073 [Phytophthora infestans T30-4]|uniref:Uncharacterized protein n=1 Tax=Phytophthora infestans (strain T30-4) TaxID=403677 RepID=D0NRL0_PHYIT|nr:uncharacterized protein PITG_15073 [Phytophthora infestans T30-4]EEY63360.1 conserved hypothetical protein [Phytophthora infestans T30-4]|eukprot:XP_002898245.1 conserved hypothetical protein [Phytophthora infestans T30-4]
MLFTSAIWCQLRRLCPLSLSSSIVAPSGINLVWGSGKGQQRIQPASGIANFPATTNSPLNISVAIGNRVVCYIPVWSNATVASLETKIARSCTFAKYLRTVKVNVTSNTAGATIIDIFYDVCHLRVQYVSTRPIPFAPTTEPTPTDTCVECKRLALDVCLRDAKCAAMADCVMQQSSGTTITIGTRLSFEAGVNSCLPAAIANGVSSVDVNGASWRKLVNASACYSRTACPLALARVLSSSCLADLKIPLSLVRDGVTVTLSISTDADSLAISLRALIQYDDIQVSADSAASTSWTISYGHWIGSLPPFIPTGNKVWTLVGYPTIVSGVAIPNESILELVSRTTSATASSTTTSQ